MSLLLNCPHCPLAFSDSQVLHTHADRCKPYLVVVYANREAVLQRDSDGVFVCPCDSDQCDAVYESSSQLLEHVAKDKPNYNAPPETVLVPSSSHPSVSNSDGILATMKQIDDDIFAHFGPNRPKSFDPAYHYTCVSAEFPHIPELSRIGLYFEPNVKLLICTGCEAALTFTSGITHVRNQHEFNVNASKYTALCSNLGVVNQFPVFDAPVPAISGLEYYPYVLRCGVPKCSKLYMTDKSIKRHYKEHHAQLPCPNSWYTTAAQKFDKSLNRSLFTVLPLPSSSSTSSSTVNWLDQIEAAIDTAVRADPLHVSDPRQLNPFLRVTLWHAHVTPYDPHHLQKLVTLPSDGEFPWLKGAVTHKFAEDVKLIGQTGLLPLQRLNTEDPQKTGVNNTPFQAHQKGDETLGKYSLEVVRLLAFLLRKREPYPLSLPTDIEDILATLRNPPVGIQLQQFVNHIQNLLFLLWSTPWSPSGGNTIGDPTICYIALSAIKADFRWAQPKDITGPLARLTYCIRLVALRKAHGHPSDVDTALDSLSDMYTAKLGNSTFNSVRSLQHLASSLAYSAVSNPVSYWLEDGGKYRTIVFAGEQITMSKLRNMGRFFILDTFEFMTENVLLNQTIAIDPTVFIHDDLSEDTPGYSFLTDPRNAFLNPYKKSLVNAIINDPQLSRHFIKGYHAGSGKPLWNLPRIRLWYEHYCELQLRFALLIQVLGGAPARGSELLCIQYRNTPSQLRGLYRMHHNWIILCQYTKTSSLTGRDKFIPHGIDAFTGNMLFHSLVCALPLAQMFAAIIFPDNGAVQKILHLNLFPYFDKPYSTDQLTSDLRNISANCLGIPLSTSEWRQFFVAVRRKHCPDFEAILDLESVDTVGALQAGHSRRTENRIYGLTPDSFTHHSEDIIKAFLEFTKKWATFMNVPAGHLPLSYRLLSDPSTYDPYLPVDDGTAPLPTELNHNPAAFALESIQQATQALAEKTLLIQAQLDHQNALLTALVKPPPVENPPLLPPPLLQLQSQTTEPPNVDDPLPKMDPAPPVPQSVHSPQPDLPPPSPHTVSDPVVPPPAFQPPQPLFSSWPPPEVEEHRLIVLEQQCLAVLRRLVKNPSATWRSLGQREGVLAVASRCNDVVVILPTGGGKTMVPLISSLLHPHSVTIFVLPFTSLIYDYQRRLDTYGIPHTVFNCESTRISGKEPIVLVSVEVAKTRHFTHCLQQASRSMSIPAIVLDEVQTVPTAQHYRESLRQIFTVRSISTQLVLLSGTIPPISLDLILHEFHIHQEAIILRSSTNRPELEYHIQPCSPSEKDLVDHTVALYQTATRRSREPERALIYVPFIDLGYEIADRLSCDFYNGRETLTPQERRAMYVRWREGTHRVMVATHAFGAGNDYDHVSLVIHAGTPFEMVNYVQEVGRAGRDGKPAKCYLIPQSSKEPFIPQDSVDHSGLRAMYNLVHDSNLCIRFLITQFIDGEGILCSQVYNDQPNQLCSRCLMDKSPTATYANKRKSPPTDHPDSDPPPMATQTPFHHPSPVYRPQPFLTPTQPNTSHSSLPPSSQAKPTPDSHHSCNSPSSSFSSSSSNGFRPASFLLKTQQRHSPIFSSPLLQKPNAGVRSPSPGPSNQHSRPTPPTNNVFEVQMQGSKRRRVDELLQTQEYTKRLLHAFSQIGKDCTCCLVSFESTQSHLANDCSSIPEGFTQLRSWRSTIKFKPQVHGVTCWVCHFPISHTGSAHPPMGKDPTTCPYQDRIPPLLWTLFFTPSVRPAIESHFHTSFSSVQAFAEWLSGKPVSGHFNNSMAVFLWFVDNYLS